MSLRPYEPLGMCTEKWMEITPELVEIDSLIPSQTHLVEHELPKGHSFCGDPIVHVVSFNNKLYISDGHHRINESKIAGEKKILARIKIKI